MWRCPVRELDLAGYLMARAAINRGIDAETVSFLCAAQRSMAAGRRKSPLGRANVREDAETSGGISFTRGQAGEKLRYQMEGVWLGHEKDAELEKIQRDSGVLKKDPAEPQRAHMHRIAMGVAAMTQSGTAFCQNEAGRFAANHAASMAEGERVAVETRFEPYAHNWAKLSSADRRIIAIADRWSRGPVVLEEDADTTESPSHPVLDMSAGQAREFAALVGRLDAALARSVPVQAALGKSMQALHAQYEHDGGLAAEHLRLLDEKPILSSAFHDDYRAWVARRRLQDQPSAAAVPAGLPAALHDEIKEAGVVRSMGLRVQAATRAECTAEVLGAMRSLMDMIGELSEPEVPDADVPDTPASR
jgi:hypothetical protein